MSKLNDALRRVEILQRALRDMAADVGELVAYIEEAVDEGTATGFEDGQEQAKETVNEWWNPRPQGR